MRTLHKVAPHTDRLDSAESLVFLWIKVWSESQGRKFHPRKSSLIRSLKRRALCLAEKFCSVFTFILSPGYIDLVSLRKSSFGQIHIHPKFSFICIPRSFVKQIWPHQADMWLQNAQWLIIVMLVIMLSLARIIEVVDFPVSTCEFVCASLWKLMDNFEVLYLSLPSAN